MFVLFYMLRIIVYNDNWRCKKEPFSIIIRSNHILIEIESKKKTYLYLILKSIFSFFFFFNIFLYDNTTITLLSSLSFFLSSLSSLSSLSFFLSSFICTILSLFFELELEWTQHSVHNDIVSILPNWNYDKTSKSSKECCL